ncbi:unnamed protein product, partial [Mesorhabditis belari]|uniref:RNase H type-1 domain-containing protein n=1 Tax=Mesorhabditis belari TaxID=2138241 RepID=A0AAF3F9F3_9BILA
MCRYGSGVHRLYCWPEYKGEKVMLRTDCLWAIKHFNNQPITYRDKKIHKLDVEDLRNLNYLKYVAGNFPKGVVIQYVTSHTKDEDPGLKKADQLATDANKRPEDKSRPKSDPKEMVTWDPSIHQHIIEAGKNAQKNWDHCKNETPMKKSRLLLERSFTKGKSRIEVLLNEPENRWIQALDIVYSPK